MLFALPSLAQAPEAAKQSVYSPAHCEFGVTFPGEPYKTRRCDEDNPEKCYDLVSYTQVFDLDTTVNFRVICNKINSEVRKTYSGDVMQATLRAMTEDTVVKTYDTSFREEEHYKQAGLVGEGEVGRSSTIYIAQLWIGDESAFSVEAEMIGSESEGADKLFSEILRSVNYKTDEPEVDSAEDEEGTSEDSDKEEKPEAKD